MDDEIANYIFFAFQVTLKWIIYAIVPEIHLA